MKKNTKRKEFNKGVGSRVREQRERLKLTREELCKDMDLSVEFLSEIERGVKGTSSESIYKLCKRLNVSADYIVMGVQAPADISPLVVALSTLDKKYIPLAEEMLTTFIRMVTLCNEI